MEGSDSPSWPGLWNDLQASLAFKLSCGEAYDNICFGDVLAQLGARERAKMDKKTKAPRAGMLDINDWHWRWRCLPERSLRFLSDATVRMAKRLGDSYQEVATAALT